MVKLLPSTQNEPIIICGGMGEGKPEFSKKQIDFNGDGDQNLDHETFRIDFKPTGFSFCKTDRKPYDMLVCLCLISLRNNIPGFSYSSDGDLEDWKPAYEFYEKHIGSGIFKLEKY